LLSLESTPYNTETFLFPEINEISSHSESSPDFSSSSPESLNNGLCEVTLYHKPRGSQGIWQPVLNGEGLRVTKGKGKRLKMKIKGPEPFEKSSLEIGLVDLTDVSASPSKSGFSIEQFFETEDPCILEIEIKLVKYCKRLQFCLTIRVSSNLIQLHSIEFSSHNNGKASRPSSQTVVQNGFTAVNPYEYSQWNSYNNATDLTGQFNDKKKKRYFRRRTKKPMLLKVLWKYMEL